MTKLPLALLLLIFSSIVSAQSSSTIGEIVAANSPPSLGGVDDLAAADFCFAAPDSVSDATLPASSSWIVAGYVHNDVGRVRVLTRQQDGSYAVAAEDSSDLRGLSCDITLADFGGNGSTWIIPEFANGAGQSDAPVYLWQAGKLSQNLFAPDGSSRLILNPMVVDLFHDGTKQLLETYEGGTGGDQEPSRSFTDKLFVLSSGNFQLKALLIFSNIYTRSTGKATAEDFPFFMAVPADTQAPYILHVLNGSDAAGDNRASSAHISLNGIEVVGPSQLNQNVAKVDVTVDLKPQNTISVLLDSQPGAKITVWIEGTPLSQK